MDSRVSVLIAQAFSCRCPRCREGSLYEGGKSYFSRKLRKKCAQCGLDFGAIDSGDGPAFFLIFILGFLVIPLAILVEGMFGWPLWAHAAVWSALSIALTLWLLRPLKALMIALQYKYRQTDWDDE